MAAPAPADQAVADAGSAAKSAEREAPKDEAWEANMRCVKNVMVS